MPVIVWQGLGWAVGALGIGGGVKIATGAVANNGVKIAVAGAVIFAGLKAGKVI